jgi:FkbM family methyltransferase
MKPASIIAIEPNPEASKVLHRNVAANSGSVPVGILEMGVGAKFGSFRVQVDQPNNLGAAKLAPDSRGAVKVYPIDVKIKDPVEFIKIDVEGMEMEVLKGAKQTIAKNRPIIFIEIMNANIPAFETWVKNAGYRVEHIFHNVHAKNFVLVPA